MAVYLYEDGRGGRFTQEHLTGYSGILQIDGYQGYNGLSNPERPGGTIVYAACWVHTRRKFYELHVQGKSRLATRTVEMMAPLWKIEAEIRGQSPEQRQVVRQERSAPIVAELFDLWIHEYALISVKSDLAEAIRYAVSKREALERFLHDGRIETDTNIVERAIRPQTITRKNAMFAGSEGGGKTWATIATLLTTAKMNNVDPLGWLTHTLERIANRWPNSKIDQLMPWNYQAKF